jgi:hypothetical protein
VAKSPPLLIRFQIDLEKEGAHEWFCPHGPLFHRWLPDGQRDAIKLNTGHPSATIRVWFERFGVTINRASETEEVVFVRDKREVDPAAMDRQGVLSAGPLFGELRLEKCDDDEMKAMTQAQLGAPPYMALAKRVLNTFILPTVSKFVRVLQLDFGQYWLRTPQAWDSRIDSLSSYCGGLRMAWSLDEGETWMQFKPDESVSRRTLSFPGGFHQYIRKGDWRGLNDLFNLAPAQSITLTLLLHSRQLLDTDNDIRLALVEGVTAAEVYIQEAQGGDIAFIKATFPGFDNMKASEQFALLALVAGSIPHEQVKLACATWDYRNKVVHDGWSPNTKQVADLEKTLENLIVVLGSLLGQSAVRVVTAFPRNAWMTSAQWEAEYKFCK